MAAVGARLTVLWFTLALDHLDQTVLTSSGLLSRYPTREPVFSHTAVGKKAKRVFTEEEKATIYQQLQRGHVLAPSLFVALLLAHFRYRSETNILLYLDGEVAVASAGLTEAFPATEPDRSRPHLTLPLAHYLTAFLSDATKAEFLPKLPLLTPAEQEVLLALRNEQVKELTVKFSHKDGQRRMDLLTKVNKQEQLTQEQLQAITQMVGLREDITLTLKTQNGTRLTLEEEKGKDLDSSFNYLAVSFGSSGDF